MGLLALIPGGGILSALGGLAGWFIKSPVGRAILGIVAVLVFLGWFYHWAETHGRAAIEAEYAKTDLRVQEQQRAAIGKSLDEANVLAAQQAEWLKTQADQLAILQMQLSAKPNQQALATACIPKAVSDEILKLRRRK